MGVRRAGMRWTLWAGMSGMSGAGMVRLHGGLVLLAEDSRFRATVLHESIYRDAQEGDKEESERPHGVSML